MVGFNTSGIIYMAINGWTSYVTGSLGITFFVLLLLFIGICVVWKLPMELIGIVILPLTIVFAMYSNLFVPIFLFDLLILAVYVFSKVFK